MKTHLIQCAAIFTLLTVIGCGNPDLALMPVKNENAGRQPVIFSGQDDLSSHVAVGTINKSVDINQLMHLTVGVRNTTSLDLYIDYRVTYFDENHNPVDMPTAWQTKTLHSDIPETIEATASTPRAKDFQIDFRSAQ